MRSVTADGADLTQDSDGRSLAVAVQVAGNDAVIHGLFQNGAEVLLDVADLQITDGLGDDAVSIELVNFDVQSGDSSGQLAGAGDRGSHGAPYSAAGLGAGQPVLNIGGCKVDQVDDRILSADIGQSPVDGLGGDDVDLFCSDSLLCTCLQKFKEFLFVFGQISQAEGFLVFCVAGSAFCFGYDLLDQGLLGLCGHLLHAICDGSGLIFRCVQHFSDFFLELFAHGSHVQSHVILL